MFGKVWRCFLGTVLGAVGAFLQPAWAAPVPVIVGGYQFEPFVEETGGVTKDLIAFLNAEQSDYEFRFLAIPARRRYDLIREGKLDLLMFEMAVWGWQDMANQIETTAPLLDGQEVFVARGDNPVGASVFNNPTARRLALTIGYHYGFADFNADPNFLKNHFDVVFAEYQRHTLRHVLAGTADVALVNNAFLERTLIREPELRSQLITSPKSDQHYELPLLIRRGGPLSADRMAAILSRLNTEKKLRPFFENQGLGRFLIDPR